MELKILDKEFNLIVIIDEAESILWHKKFNELGECEIYLPCTEEYLNLLQKDFYITRQDDDMVCIITKRQITTSAEGADYLVVFGYEASSILRRRVTWGKVSFNGKVADLIKTVITQSIISPTRTNRRISNFVMDTSNLDQFTDLINYASEEENVYTIVEGLCQSYGYGFKTTLDNGIFTFHLYLATDKASKEGINQYIEFSSDNQNILETEYEEDKEALKNTMLVKGENDNLVIIEDTSGMERREAVLNVTIPMTWTDDLGIEHTYTTEEYMNILRGLGKAELAKLNEEVTFSGTVDVIDTYIYRQDYNVGDIVAIKNKFGISITALITEVMESEDNENGYEVEPVFSYNHNAPTFENSYILTESKAVMMTEAAVALISEAGISTASSKKISELPQTTTIQDGSCFPIVQDGETKKIFYSELKALLKGDKGDKGDTPELLLREDGHLIAIYP